MNLKTSTAVQNFLPFLRKKTALAGEGYLTRIITILLVALITLPACEEEPSAPTGTNKIEMGTTTGSTISYRMATVSSSAEALQGNQIKQHGHVWGTAANPTTENSKTSLGPLTEAKTFSSNLENLEPSTQYFVRSYITTEYETLYGKEVEITTLETKIPTVSTATITEITVSSAVSGGNVQDNGGLQVTARGIVWGTSPNPTLENNTGKTTDGTGTGSFTSDLTGLQEGMTYYVRAYATNSKGTGYGDEVEFNTIFRDTETTVVDVTNPATGKTWMDRNLGAGRAATGSTDTEAYGDLYQWGRAADGHQKRTSGTTSTRSSSDIPGHDDFIITDSGSNYDWRNPQNNNLWQGVNGTNNPCPHGYRLPTIAELEAERQSWSSNNSAGAFSSPLKLPVAGYRGYSNGSLVNVGSYGRYWSSTVDGTYSRTLYFYSSNANTGSSYRAYGRSVRCLKD